MTKHREAMKAAMKHFRLGSSPRERDVEEAIRTYHEKAFKRVNNAPVDGLPATKERYVGPWEEKSDDHS